MSLKLTLILESYLTLIIKIVNMNRHKQSIKSPNKCNQLNVLMPKYICI